MITVIRYGKLATFILFFITLIYSISHLFIENTNIFLRNIISILPIVNTFIYLLISIPISRLSNKYLRNFSIGEALVVLCMMLIYLEKPYFLLKNREYSVSIMVIIFLLLSIPEIYTFQHFDKRYEKEIKIDYEKSVQFQASFQKDMQCRILLKIILILRIAIMIFIRFINMEAIYVLFGIYVLLSYILDYQLIKIYRRRTIVSCIAAETLLYIVITILLSLHLNVLATYALLLGGMKTTYLIDQERKYNKL